MPQPPVEPNKRISPYTLSGTVLLLIGVLLFIMVALFDLPDLPSTIIRSLGVISLVGATVLGLFAIRQIRSSPGQYSSMRLSVFVLVFFPIIVLDLLLFILGWRLLAEITSSSLIALGWLVLVILIDYWVVRLIWNRVIL